MPPSDYIIFTAIASAFAICAVAHLPDDQLTAAPRQLDLLMD